MYLLVTSVLLLQLIMSGYIVVETDELTSGPSWSIVITELRLNSSYLYLNAWLRYLRPTSPPTSTWLRYLHPKTPPTSTSQRLAQVPPPHNSSYLYLKA